MTESGGYERVMALSRERPDLLPLVRLIHDMGAEDFTDGLRELVARGILQTNALPEWIAS